MFFAIKSFAGAAGNIVCAVSAKSPKPVQAIKIQSLIRGYRGFKDGAVALSTLCLFLCWVLVSPPLSAGVEVYDLVNKMSHSYRELNYQGVFSFQQGSDLHSLKVSHAVIDGEEFERLEHLDTIQGDIIRRGHSVNCLHPGHQMLRILSRQFDSDAPAEPVTAIKIADYYQLLLVGESRVAGRETREVLLSPRDSHRFSHRLSLDRDTGLLLKSVLLAADNSVLEQFQFADITIGQPLEKAFFTSSGHGQVADHRRGGAVQAHPISLSSSRWSVEWLPQGYLSVAADEYMETFTDGLSAFSVFLEVIEPQGSAREGHSQRGATIAFSKPVLLTGRPHQVTVVGEIPRHTAQKIAQSVVRIAMP